jgi:16S rRNA (guanine966-N2)-methyltransferase
VPYSLTCPTPLSSTCSPAPALSDWRHSRAARVTSHSSSPLRVLQANVHKLRAEADIEVVRADALKYVAGLPAGAFDIVFADPPYGTGAAEGLAELFRERAFAQQLWIEHRSGEPVPALPGAHTRRYGDTALTFIPAPESA